MSSQTNARDIPARKADADATTAAVAALGAALPLPAGAATAAKQDAEIALLTTIDADTSKIPTDPAREGGNLKTISDQVSADGLKARSPDAAKFLTTELNSGTIKTAVELLDDAVGALGALVGTLKGIVVQGSDGANVRPLLTDATGRLLMAQGTAADLRCTEASGSAIAGSAATIATAAGKLADDRKLIPLAFSAAAIVDGGEVQLTGFTASAYYTLLQFNSTPHTGGGIATHRQRRIYRATGGLIADLCWEEPTDLAVADGAFYPFSQLGNVCQADAAGKMWLRYEVTGGGSITETGDLAFFPLRTA